MLIIYEMILKTNRKTMDWQIAIDIYSFDKTITVNIDIRQ